MYCDTPKEIWFPGVGPAWLCAISLVCIWLICSPAVANASAATQEGVSERSIKTATDTATNTATNTAAKSASKAYCGVRCLYAAALAEGVDFPAADLVRPEYIGSREGSSLEELERAARDHKLHTFAFVNGTPDALSSEPHPTLLHVESVAGSGRYDHFVLCLGKRDGKLLVLDTVIDPGAPAQLMSPRDVEFIWDGSGLIVSKTPIETRLFAGSAGVLICWGGGVLGLIVVGRQLLPGGQSRATPFYSFLNGGSGVGAEMLAIAVAALLAPTVSALCADAGILAHKQQIRMVEQTHITEFLKRVSIPDVEKRRASGRAVLVDARFAADYSAGHISGAINIPVTASAGMVRSYMAAIPHESPVIVYCQSRSCPFSKAVAAALLQENYTSVQLMDGGWEEWSAWKQ